MAFNGSGVHNRIHDWTTDLAGAVPVTASRMDADSDDFSTALSLTICRDGQSTTTARIPFASGTSTAAGSVSAASYAQTNDTNTGMYFPAVDQFGLTAGGVATITSTATKVTMPVAVDFTGAAAPTTSDGAALGSVTQPWSDLFLATGAVINFGGTDVTVTHSANLLAFAGAASGYTFDGLVSPATNDNAALGTGTVSFSDLFLASGAVINFNNGNATMTHAAGSLTTVVTTFAITGALTVSNGLTVSAGAVSLPAASVADAALALPGAWKFIGTQTASASATIDFASASYASAFDGTYDHIMIAFANVKPATDAVRMDLRIGTGAGPTYQTTGYKYGLAAADSAGLNARSSASDGQINLSLDVGTAAGEHVSGFVHFANPELTDFFSCEVSARTVDSTSAPRSLNGMGMYGTAGAITAVRFLMSVGNIASGTFAIYGLKKSG